MERIDMLWEPVRVILMQIGEFFPRVLLAIVILVVGWLLAKALRFARSKAQRRQTQKWLLGKMIFVDSSRRMRFCEKMLRHWSPWRAARPVVIETLILAARGLHRGFFEILVGQGCACPRMPRHAPFRKTTGADLSKSPRISHFGKIVSTGARSSHLDRLRAGSLDRLGAGDYAAALASLTRSMSAPTAASFCSIFS